MKCSEGYYFVEGGTAGECKTPTEIEELNDGFKYFLPEGSDTFKKCDLNCICEKKKEYCIGCTNDYNFKEDENKCKSDTNIDMYYLNSDNVFKKCYNTCFTCSGPSSDECTKCKEPYYLIELENNVKRCITQIEKKANSEYDKSLEMISP